MSNKGTHKPRPCPFCDYLITDYEAGRQHYVDKHGCKRVGAQVFRSYPCRYCDKPALYKVGSVGFCKEHKSEAVRRTNYAVKKRDQEHTQYAQQFKEGIGADIKAKDSLNRWHASRNKDHRV